jgi:pyruvate formate lyase activating enzyme
MPHALATARLLAERGIVICWETAGTANPKLMKRALELSLESGGCVKFDLKAFDDNLHQVLTGGSNRRTLDNFSTAVTRFHERPSPPLVVASTLLVPGYVDADEVSRIAAFIADHNPEIPYGLLAFHPHFEMTDLPRTSMRHGKAALMAALDAGLKNVRLGNLHLFSEDY